MKGVELRDLAMDELEDKLRDFREELFNLRFQLATGQLDNHRRIRAVKRDLARVKGMIREHELTLEGQRAAEADTTEEAKQ